MIRRARRTRIRREMDRLAHELEEAMAADPDGFAEREALWMRREALRDKLHKIGD